MHQKVLEVIRGIYSFYQNKDGYKSHWAKDILKSLTADTMTNGLGSIELDAKPFSNDGGVITLKFDRIK